jgi:dihydroflavonol-4-reductase
MGCGYKQSKWHSEREALAAAREGMDVVIASPTAPIGPGDDRPTPTGRMIVDLMHRRFPACSRTGINVVAVEDVARGLLAVAARGERGQRYILGHDNLWLDQFLARVAAQLGVPAPRAWVPWLAVALGGLASDAFSLCTGRGGGRLCWETAYFARQVQFFDIGRSRRDLGWTPTLGLEDAISRSVAWFSGRNPGTTPGMGTARQGWNVP